jgi:hypothetical protein
MFLNTSDTPKRWEVKTISPAFTGGAVAGGGFTVSGLAMDNAGNVFISNSNNGMLYRFTYDGSGTEKTRYYNITSLKGIWCDATTSNPTGNNIYVIEGTELWIYKTSSLGTGSVISNPSVATNGPWKITGLPNTPNQLTVFGAGANGVGGGTCYYTGGSTITKFTIPAIPGDFSSGSNTAVISFTTWTPSNPSISGNGQLIVDKNGTLYMANGPSNNIVKIDSAGNSQIFVGGGASPGNNPATPGTIVDSGANSANAAQPGGGVLFNAATGLALSSDTLTMYVADTGDFLIRQIT